MASPTSRGDGTAGSMLQRLGPADLLDVWEEGHALPPVSRALAILRRALPDTDRAGLADLPVGTRDSLLLQLRELHFGPVAECVATCPACAATIEFPVTVRDLVVDGPPQLDTVVEWQGLTLRVRAATSRDQLSLAGLTDPEEMAGLLLDRCAAVAAAADAPFDTLRAGTGDNTPDYAVPPEAADLVSSTMTRLDPGSDLRFALSCPTCNATWTSVFDAVAFLWREMEVAARRLLADVHVLATAYGWSESEILNLSPARRHAYLRLARPS